MNAVSLSKNSTHSNKQVSRAFNERGVTMLEFSIVIPLIFGLIVGIVDVTRAFNTYMVLTQIVHEGARTGAGTAALEPVQFCSNIDGSACPSQTAVGGEHQKMFDRMKQLLTVHETKDDIAISANNVQISTRFISPTDPTMTGTNTIKRKTVVVSLSTKYSAIFPMWDGIGMTVTAEAPYLYSN